MAYCQAHFHLDSLVTSQSQLAVNKYGSYIDGKNKIVPLVLNTERP